VYIRAMLVYSLLEFTGKN